MHSSETCKTLVLSTAWLRLFAAIILILPGMFFPEMLTASGSREQIDETGEAETTGSAENDKGESIIYIEGLCDEAVSRRAESICTDLSAIILDELRRMQRPAKILDAADAPDASDSPDAPDAFTPERLLISSIKNIRIKRFDTIPDSPVICEIDAELQFFKDAALFWQDVVTLAGQGEDEDAAVENALKYAKKALPPILLEVPGLLTGNRIEHISGTSVWLFSREEPITERGKRFLVRDNGGGILAVLRSEDLRYWESISEEEREETEKLIKENSYFHLPEAVQPNGETSADADAAGIKDAEKSGETVEIEDVEEAEDVEETEVVEETEEVEETMELEETKSNGETVEFLEEPWYHLFPAEVLFSDAPLTAGMQFEDLQRTAEYTIRSNISYLFPLGISGGVYAVPDTLGDRVTPVIGLVSGIIFPNGFVEGASDPTAWISASAGLSFTYHLRGRADRKNPLILRRGVIGGTVLGGFGYVSNQDLSGGGSSLYSANFDFFAGIYISESLTAGIQTGFSYLSSLSDSNFEKKALHAGPYVTISL